MFTGMFLSPSAWGLSAQWHQLHCEDAPGTELRSPGRVESFQPSSCSSLTNTFCCTWHLLDYLTLLLQWLPQNEATVLTIWRFPAPAIWQTCDKLNILQNVGVPLRKPISWGCFSLGPPYFPYHLWANPDSPSLPDLSKKASDVHHPTHSCSTKLNWRLLHNPVQSEHSAQLWKSGWIWLHCGHMKWMWLCYIICGHFLTWNGRGACYIICDHFLKLEKCFYFHD